LPAEETTVYDAEVSKVDLQKAKESSKAAKHAAARSKAQIVADQPAIVWETINILDKWNKNHGTVPETEQQEELREIAQQSNNPTLKVACEQLPLGKIQGPDFAYNDARHKAQIMRAYNCSVAASSVVDADFVMKYGTQTLLKRRDHQRLLENVSRNGLHGSLYYESKSRVEEKPVHDKGKIGHHAGTLELLDKVLGVKLSELRPPKYTLTHQTEIGRENKTAVIQKLWLVESVKVNERLEDPHLGVREFLASIAPHLAGKPFQLGKPFHLDNLPTDHEGWDVVKAISCLDAVLKAFGLQVATERYGKKGQKKRYALALSKTLDDAMSKVLAAEVGKQ
jgi:hypothetical protein